MKFTSVVQLLVVMVTLFNFVLIQKVEGKPNSEEITNVMEAIKFLDNLEKYYNEKSRPRYVNKQI